MRTFNIDQYKSQQMANIGEDVSLLQPAKSKIFAIKENKLLYGWALYIARSRNGSRCTEIHKHDVCTW